MRVKLIETIVDGDSTVAVQKNNGRHVAYVPIAFIKRALRQHGKHVVVEYNGKRYGFDREYLRLFCFENADGKGDFYTTTAQDVFNAIRRVD